MAEIENAPPALLQALEKGSEKEKALATLDILSSHNQKSNQFDIGEYFQTLSAKQQTKLWHSAHSLTQQVLDELFPTEDNAEDHRDENDNSADQDLTSPPARPSKAPASTAARTPGGGGAAAAAADWALPLLEAVAKIALVFIEDAARAAPRPLLACAEALHGALFRLEDLGLAGRALQLGVVRLCEAWYLGDRPGGQALVAMAVPLLLREALEGDRPARAVKRVHALRGALLLLDLAAPSAAHLRLLLRRAPLSPAFLRAAEGRRFLSFLFGLNPDFVDELHLAIKGQIPHARKSVLKIYGEIYFRSWAAASGPYRERLEAAVQDLARGACLAPRPPLAAALRAVLAAFHEQKEQKKGVDALLARLYEPILWRLLRVAHPLVREQACRLLADAFPVVDYGRTNAEVDAQLQRQFDLLQQLLVDDAPRVRAAAAAAAARVLGGFWEAVPAETARPLLTRLVGGLACDAAAADVRAAVATALGELLETQPLALPALRGLLPMAAHLLHDKSEKVRLAFVGLLGKVKAARGLKFYHVAPVDQLLRRLALDAPAAPAVARALTGLLLNSYFPQGPEVPGSQQVARCLHFLQQDRRAAKAFYSNIHEFISVEAGVKLIVMLSKCLFKAMSLEDEDDTTKNENADGPESEDGESEAEEELEAKSPVAKKQNQGGQSAPELSALALKRSARDVAEVVAALVGSLRGALHRPAHRPALDMLLECFGGGRLAALYRWAHASAGGGGGNARAAVLRVAGLLPPELFPDALELLLTEVLALPEDAPAAAYGPAVQLLAAWGQERNLVAAAAAALRAALEGAAGGHGGGGGSGGGGGGRAGRRKRDRASGAGGGGAPPPLPPGLALRLLGALLRPAAAAGAPSSSSSPAAAAAALLPLGAAFLADADAVAELRAVLEDGRALLDAALAPGGALPEGVPRAGPLLLGCLEMLARLHLHQEALTAIARSERAAAAAAEEGGAAAAGEGEEGGAAAAAAAAAAGAPLSLELPDGLRELLVWATERALPAAGPARLAAALAGDRAFTGEDGTAAADDAPPPTAFGSPLPLPPPRRRTRGGGASPAVVVEAAAPVRRPAAVRALARAAFGRLVALAADAAACGAGRAELGLRADIWGARLLAALAAAASLTPSWGAAAAAEEEDEDEEGGAAAALAPLLPALCRLAYQLLARGGGGGGGGGCGGGCGGGGGGSPALWEALLRLAHARRAPAEDDLLAGLKLGPTEVEKLMGSSMALLARRKDLHSVVAEWIDFVFAELDSDDECDEPHYSDFNPSIKFKTPAPDSILTAILKSSDGTKAAVAAAAARLALRSSLRGGGGGGGEEGEAVASATAGLRLVSVLVDRAPPRARGAVAARHREFLLSMGHAVPAVATAATCQQLDSVAEEEEGADEIGGEERPEEEVVCDDQTA